MAVNFASASAGAYVTIANEQEDADNRLVAELTSKGHHATFVRCDVTNWASATAAFKHATNSRHANLSTWQPSLRA